MYPPLVDSPSTLLRSIATVNTQLYRQLSAQNRPDRELWDIRRAYDLTSELYSGAYQADGRPFTAHVVSVASILALIGMPSWIVATGLIHNVYGNGDFGDGRFKGITPERRWRVREAVGSDIEGCVHRFSELRLPNNLDSVKASLANLCERDRQILCIEFADLLDKYADSSILYFGDCRWVTRFVDAREDDLVAIGNALGQPLLTEALREAIAQVRSSDVPQPFRGPPDRKYLYTLIPPSCIRRPKLTWMAAIKSSLPWRIARRVIRGAPA